MLEIQNNTQLQTHLFSGVGKLCDDFVILALKGSFAIDLERPMMVRADDQLPILQQDVYYGEPALSSMEYESDLALVKEHTDIVLNGYAWSQSGKPTTSVDVKLQVDNHQKIVRVFGDRHWMRSFGRWRPSEPTLFQHLPLVYENAYGGKDTRAKTASFSPYNPIGKGFIDPDQGPEHGQPLPNIEDPTMLITHWKDQPKPAGFGFIGRNWQPRLAHAGSYSPEWLEIRAPLLPEDFSYQYFSGAHPNLVLPLLSGGEQVTITNILESGDVSFRLPSHRLQVGISIKGREYAYLPNLDTVVIEPEKLRVHITWRVTAPCHRQFAYIDVIRVQGRIG